MANCKWCGKTINGPIVSPKRQSFWKTLIDQPAYCSVKCREEHENTLFGSRNQEKTASKKGGSSGLTIFLWIVFFPILFCWWILKGIFKLIYD